MLFVRLMISWWSTSFHQVASHMKSEAIDLYNTYIRQVPLVYHDAIWHKTPVDVRLTAQAGAKVIISISRRNLGTSCALSILGTLEIYACILMFKTEAFFDIYNRLINQSLSYTVTGNFHVLDKWNGFLFYPVLIMIDVFCWIPGNVPRWRSHSYRGRGRNSAILERLQQDSIN